MEKKMRVSTHENPVLCEHVVKFKGYNEASEPTFEAGQFRMTLHNDDKVTVAWDSEKGFWRNKRKFNCTLVGRGNHLSLTVDDPALRWNASMEIRGGDVLFTKMSPEKVDHNKIISDYKKEIEQAQKLAHGLQETSLRDIVSRFAGRAAHL
jgi:hypothetical protein